MDKNRDFFFFFLHFKDFCAKYNLNCSIGEYNKVTKLIPAPFKSMTEQRVLHAKFLVLRTLSVDRINLGSKQFSNRFNRSALTTKYHPYQMKKKSFLSFPVPHEAK